MVGRPLDHRFPPREPVIGDEIFRIEDWTVHHPSHPDRIVVDGATLSVAEGEIVGIAGLMGAGRTELAMSLFGRQYGTNISGRAFKRGQEIHPDTVQQAIQSGLAYVSEDGAHDGWIRQVRQHPALASATGAPEDVEGERALQQPCPVQARRALTPGGLHTRDMDRRRVERGCFG